MEGENILVLDGLISGNFLCRPSKKNRSPFVGDVMVDGEERIVHVPSMDMGGKCVNGTKIYMKESKNKGKCSKKYGTPCCDYISQAILVEEPENGQPVICGAHPSLGEMIADELLGVGKVFSPMSSEKITFKKGQVSKIAGCDMRSDFLVRTEDGTYYLIEIKTIVDTDYDLKNKEHYASTKKTVYYGENTGEDYRRKCLFPWGRGNQKGPCGEKVVSSRAIKHVMEMTDIARGVKCDDRYENLVPYVMFVVVRDDVVEFTPNKRSCPSFHRYLKEGSECGLKMTAISVSLKLSDQLRGCRSPHPSSTDLVSLDVIYNKELPIVF